MEEWFHTVNNKEKVRSARPLIAKVLRLLKKVFPQTNGQGYHIQKYHGMTKMQTYMCLFGCAINFYGGPGESAHKYFVKAPGNNTQRRVSEFSMQVAQKVYKSMIFEIAMEHINQEN